MALASVRIIALKIQCPDSSRTLTRCSRSLVSHPRTSRRGPLTAALFDCSQAFLQSSDQVDDIALRRLRSCGRSLLAFGFGLDQFLNLFGVSIPVFGGIE